MSYLKSVKLHDTEINSLFNGAQFIAIFLASWLRHHKSKNVSVLVCRLFCHQRRHAARSSSENKQEPLHSQSCLSGTFSIAPCAAFSPRLGTRLTDIPHTCPTFIALPFLYSAPNITPQFGKETSACAHHLFRVQRNNGGRHNFQGRLRYLLSLTSTF